MSRNVRAMRFVSVFATLLVGIMTLVGWARSGEAAGMFALFFPLVVPIYVITVAEHGWPREMDARPPTGTSRALAGALGILSLAGVVSGCALLFNMAVPISAGWSPAWIFFAAMAAVGLFIAALQRFLWRRPDLASRKV